MSFKLQAAEASPVTPTTTITPLFDNASIIASTAIDGWVAKVEFSSTDKSCGTRQGSVKLFPMGVCMPSGDKNSFTAVCNADNVLAQNLYEDVAWNTCDISVEGIEAKCGKTDRGGFKNEGTCIYNQEDDGKKYNCNDAIDLGTVADLPACVAACNAHSTCERLTLQKDTKKCEGFTDSCDSQESDDDYVMTNKWARDESQISDCSAGQKVPIAGGVITHWYPGKAEDGHSEKTIDTADCTTKTSDKDWGNAGPNEMLGFIFDKCVPDGTNESYTVHCVSSKVYKSEYGSTDCSGAVTKSTEIKKACTLNENNNGSYEATWWGQCETTGAEAPVVEAECITPPGCKLKAVCEDILTGSATPDGLHDGHKCSAHEAAWDEEGITCEDISGHFAEHADKKTSFQDNCCAGPAVSSESSESDDSSGAPSKFILVAVFGSLVTALVSTAL